MLPTAPEAFLQRLLDLAGYRILDEHQIKARRAAPAGTPALDLAYLSNGGTLEGWCAQGPRDRERGGGDMSKWVTAAEDRAVLEELYWATGGPHWPNRANWLKVQPANAWHGVTTNEGGRVIGIDRAPVL